MFKRIDLHGLRLRDLIQYNIMIPNLYYNSETQNSQI